jgi:hypothetical protein
MFSPLPVPTGGSDFPPEPSATWAVDEFEKLHLPLTDSLQTELVSGQRFFKSCCSGATMLASRMHGT